MGVRRRRNEKIQSQQNKDVAVVSKMMSTGSPAIVLLAKRT
jgi:hypothetical protein